MRMVYEGVFALVILLTITGSLLWLALRGLEALLRARAPLFAHAAAMLAFVVPVASSDRIWISVKDDWIDGFRLAARVWLWGALALGLVLLVMRAAACIGVSRSPLCRDRRLLALYEACVRRTHARRPALRCGNLGTAACVCLAGLRPAVIVDADVLAGMDDGSIEHIFLHELTHVRRGHLWLGMVADCLCCLHWMNPIAWLARRAWALRCEQDCDAHVVSNHLGMEAASYMHTIVLTLQSNAHGGRSAARWMCGSPRFGQYRLAKKRLERLVHPARPSSRRAALCLSMALIAGAAFFSFSASGVMLDSRYPAAGDPTQIECASGLSRRVFPAG